MSCDSVHVGKLWLDPMEHLIGCVPIRGSELERCMSRAVAMAAGGRGRGWEGRGGEGREGGRE